MITRQGIEPHWQTFAIAFVIVAVVLLVIQIVVTPMFDAGLAFAVEFPHSKAAHFISPTERDLHVTVRADGRVFVGPDGVRPEKVASELADLRSYAPNRRVFLRVDRGAAFGSFRAVFAGAVGAGFTKVTLITFEGTVFDLLAQNQARSQFR